MPEKILKFPDNFLWGVSTAAYQVEGGIECDWSEWERSELRIANCELRIKKEKLSCSIEDFICGQACDSYQRWEEDIELIKSLNCNAYRFGIEWARIEPEEGRISREAIEHYRRMIALLKEKNIKPVVTLWHWTNPKWIGSRGWLEKDTVDKFIKYSELVVSELGSGIEYWVTLNEPLMHIAHGYLDGKFPPNCKADLSGSWKVFHNLVDAHKRVYELIHKFVPDAKVSIAMTTGYFDPAHSWNPIEAGLAKLGHYFRNIWYLKKIKGFYDYIGVNYYHHNRMIWHPPFTRNLNEKVSDFGWELFPEGIYHVLMAYKEFQKPLIILESGISDADDGQRGDYIKDILAWTHKAITEGADVRGHFYWSLLDNFEWADGYTQKFGLFEVDRRTFERKRRRSSDFYAGACKNNSISV